MQQFSHVPTDLLIAGIWRPAADNQRFAVSNPATQKTLAHVSSAQATDAVAALAACHEAQGTLAQTTPRVRSDFLHELYRKVMSEQDTFAELICAESGKPLAEARGEVQYAADYLRWFAEEALRMPGLTRQAPDGHLIHVSAKPVGPAYLIAPWNFPLAMITRKFAPAFAAGCSSIWKPASATPLTTLMFAQITVDLLVDNDLPSGAIAVLPTADSAGVTDALVTDSRLRKVSFTGSTQVGAQLLAQCAPNILRTSMELGGNAPFIVMNDADLVAATSGAMAAKMRNAGQTCVAANRFLVHKSVVKEFTERLTHEFSGLITGNGMDPDTTVGPLISASAVNTVCELVTRSQARGARTAYQASNLPADGTFFPPTILITDEHDPILGEEIFGPVAVIVAVDSLEHAIRLANDTPYGLVGYAYTQSVTSARTLTEQLDVGMLGLNRGSVSDATAPFGGVKHSGIGREGGAQGILEYLSLMYVAQQ